MTYMYKINTDSTKAYQVAMVFECSPRLGTRKGSGTGCGCRGRCRVALPKTLTDVRLLDIAWCRLPHPDRFTACHRITLGLERYIWLKKKVHVSNNKEPVK